MSKIKATCIKNPFQPRIAENRDEREFDFKNQTIADIFCEYYPIPSADVRIVASVNGKVYENADWKQELDPGDHIVFVPIPQGGGGGSNVLAIVAMVVVAAIAWYAGPALAGAGGLGMTTTSAAGVTSLTVGGQMVAGLTSAAIMVGGGMLVSSIFPTKAVGLGSGDLSENSPTYGWSSYNNATQEGTMLPVIIGERRVAPPLIAAHSETIDGDAYLYLLYAVAEGPIEAIYGLELDEQPLGYYSGIKVYTRLGSNTGTVLPYFGDVYSDSSVNVSLSKDSYVVRETSGTGVDAVQVHLCMPMGLWYANDKGGMDEQTISFSIQYRKVGDVDWLTYYGDEEDDSWEDYESGKTYNVGEIVFYNNKFYKCTAYYCHFSGSKRSGDETYSYDYYGYTTKSYTYYKKEVLPTPDPTDGECWELYAPRATSILITSNSNSAINKTYRINFPVRGQYQIQVKVMNSPPTDNPRYGSKSLWSGLTEIMKDDIAYPGVALIGMRIKATDQLSGGIPKVTCIARKNTHTFPVAGTVSLKNPAWASYYILNNSVWGGDVPESKINLTDFQTWATYCNSKGITCTMYVDQRMTYNDLKNYICELGRANIIQMGSKFGVVIDKPDVPTQLFTIGNIIKDSFSMNYLPMDDRANVIRVNYYDKDQNWEKSTVEVRTDEFVTGNKEKAQDITLYACDRKDLAARHARLLLNYNINLLRTCSFDVSIDAIACTIGDIIKVQHDITRYGFGGRLVSDVEAAYPRLLKLDRKIALAAGVIYGVLIRNDDNDDIDKYEFTVPTTADYDQISTTVNMSPLPQKGAVYSIGETNIEAKPFRILAITRSEEFTRKITALEYHAEVYDDTHIIDDVQQYFAEPVVGGINVVEVIDNVYSKYTSARLSWSCHGSRGSYVSYQYTSGTTLVKKNLGKTQETVLVLNNLPINIPIKFIVAPVNNPQGADSVTATFYGETSAVYENGCYEMEVFADHKLQEKFGHKTPYTLWMQEPQSVTMKFIQ